jgi:threonine aldolase
MKIDLRSDTVTRPGPGMLEAMMRAEVGDDVFDEDPTVHKLQQKIAAMFDKEAALFCPSGTMTNQIAVRIQTQPQDEIICDWRSHVYNYEGGGVAYNSLCSVKLLDGDRGRITAAEIEDNIRPVDLHAPLSSLICLENTVNKGGGSYYTLDQVAPIRGLARKYNLGMHLDGARIFNALAETCEKPADVGQYFDTISVCLSKGLGAPVGSLLLGGEKLIAKAKRVRKVLGGAMRQAGYLAAAGIYALDNNIERLKEDHERARELGDCLSSLPFVEELLPVDTNIVIFKLPPKIKVTSFLAALNERDILATPFGKQEVRFVTHLDFTGDMLDRSIEILKSLRF